jgi:TonB family protein
MRKLACLVSLVLLAAAVTANAQPLQPVRVGGNILPPKKTKDVRPAYPAIAQSARVQGVVILEAIIGVDGRVQDAKVLRSIPLLDAAAIEAVRQWEFTPTTLNGLPVPVIMTVTVNFMLDEDLPPRSCGDEPSMRSPEGAPPASIQFINQSEVIQRVYWLDATGVRHWFLTVGAGESATQVTSVGHTWVVTDSQDACIAVYVATSGTRRALLSRGFAAPAVASPPNVAPR